jgi:hypothetical protein
LCRRNPIKNHKVLLIGDSHARDCARKISNYLGNDHEVTGYVHPSSGLKVIINSAKKEVTHMTKRDVVIVCGGVNNINKNQSIKGLKSVIQLVQNRSKHKCDHNECPTQIRFRRNIMCEQRNKGI